MNKTKLKKLIKHSRKLVNYLIDDESKHYSETKNSLLEGEILDNHIYDSIREVAKIVKYKRLEQVEKKWEINKLK